MNTFDFAGKTVLLTGASMGIGEAFARELSRRGATLILVARSEAKLEALATELGNAHVIPQDLTTAGAAKRVFDAVTAKGLDVDVLINNAGFGINAAFDDIPLTTQREQIDLNVGALMELTYLFLPTIERRQGGVIQVASMASFMPCPYMAVYGATKAFVLSFGEALWAEYRPRGVRVLTLCPGATDTPFFERAGAVGGADKRARPEDVVEVGLAAFLAGRATVIQGTANYVASLSPRFLPREFTAKTMARIAKPKEPARLRAARRGA
ncbi:SDR family NAD(P)-dependent oxidoreductase [Chondromyces crocatus]|uniref:Short-chain dehydrogenase n=1 Tax=Chondromyces crocatus TaxID=52 RepID=A0A0K1ECQ1_CHOCO|nr:SDR family oxidoreductase [Chondromyces crocatus]AKT38477.1 short-chain dehydrogenase [Chondromyces crocatus]